MKDPFHEGERAVQEEAGERDIAVSRGALIFDRIPPTATKFIAAQTYCVLGGADQQQDLWAFFLAGPEGFATTNDQLDKVLFQNLGQAGMPLEYMPFTGLRPNDHIGALFIELSTRRRLRVNGRVGALSDQQMEMKVLEAFPNCPRYIQRREFEEGSLSGPKPALIKGQALNDELIGWIEGADMFLWRALSLAARLMFLIAAAMRVLFKYVRALCAYPTIRGTRCSALWGISKAIRVPGWSLLILKTGASCSSREKSN